MMEEEAGSTQVRPTMLLSSLVQTRSIELVLAPIAAQVSQLIILAETRGNPYPNLVPKALTVNDSVQNLANVGKKIVSESADEKLQVDLPVAYSQALSAGQQLVAAAGALAENPVSTEAPVILHTAALGLLEGAMKTLLVWDEGEVRKIIRAAHWTLDRLGLVKVAKSMRSLVICFGGVSEAMMLLLSLADKRQKELTDQEMKENVLAALNRLQASILPFSEAMKNYVRDPSNVHAQNIRNERAGEMSSAIYDLIQAVKTFDDDSESEPDNMATNIMEVQRKLAPDSRYFIGPDLDKHLEAIHQNSMAVAHVSQDHYRENIERLCNEMMLLRKELGENLLAITENPHSVEAREAFDQSADQLCKKLCEIDRWVADAVVDQVTEAFVEPSAPIHHLVQAAGGRRPSSSSMTSSDMSPPSSPYASQESDTLTKQVELFRRHSKRLSQVAAHAAQSSADAKRVQLITDLAGQVDQLMPQVVEAAVAVKRSPSDVDAKVKLETSRKDWAAKVQQLTTAIDDIIDPEDFMAVSENNIYQDMTKCRDAVDSQNWSLLKPLVQGIAAKATRVAEVGKMAASQEKEPRKKERITQAVGKLENAIPIVVSQASNVITNPDSQQYREQFAQSLKQLLDSIHQTQAALKSTNTEATDFSLSPGLATSTPILAPLERTRHKPRPPGVSPVPPSPPPIPPPSKTEQRRYIGSLKRWSDGKRRPTENRIDVEENDSGDVSHFLSSSQIVDGDRSTSTRGTQTLTPKPQSRDQALQADIRYPSDSSGSEVAAITLSPTLHSPSSSSLEKGESLRPHRPKPPESPTHKTLQSYASPLQKLLTVAKEGQTESVQSFASDLQARSIRLTNIAESAAGAVRHNSQLMKVLKVKASEVEKLTPRVIQHAEGLVQDPKEAQRLKELKMSSHQWAGHVRQLMEATQKANYPWSKTAEQLVSSAKKGEGLEDQMKHVSTQTARMVDIAMATVKAAEAEETLGSSDDSEVSHDPEMQEQLLSVLKATEELKKLTPQLLSAAEVVGEGPSPVTIEHLNILSQEWATKAKVLMHKLDDVSLGISGPADTLLLSARSGDAVLLSDQAEALTNLASSLHSVAEDALQGCQNERKAKLVREASDRIKRTSTQLIDCAHRVAVVCGGEDGDTMRRLEAMQDTLEDTELLRRDWASQVHLITAHIDELIAKVSAPLDRLVDVALQVSRVSVLARQQLMLKFESRARFISNQLEVVDRSFQEATGGGGVEGKETALQEAAMALSLLQKLTPHAIGACRALSSDPGSALLEHFGHLRRQWGSKAQTMLIALKKVTSADMSEVLAAFEQLLRQPKSGHTTPRQSGSITPAHRSYSFEDVEEEEETGHLVIKEKPASRLDPHKRFSATDDSLTSQVVQASKRPTSMAVPLPSWNKEKEDESTRNKSSRSIAVAAKRLHEVASEFQEKDNEMITLAKTMAHQMTQMGDFSRGKGELQNKTEMINTAKAIAANAHSIVKFASDICEQCIDERMKMQLESCAEMIPTLSTQLRIIASVKASTPDDTSADVMLVRNAQNLMMAVVQTVKAAEAACMRGMKDPEDSSQMKAVSLALNWKRKLYYTRTLESLGAATGTRGLRKLNRSHISTPSLVDTIQQQTM